VLERRAHLNLDQPSVSLDDDVVRPVSAWRGLRQGVVLLLMLDRPVALSAQGDPAHFVVSPRRIARHPPISCIRESFMVGCRLSFSTSVGSIGS
jgi:hypothetical protein